MSGGRNIQWCINELHMERATYGSYVLQAMLEGHLGELPNKRQKTAEAVPAAAAQDGDASQPPFGSGNARLELTEVYTALAVA